MRWTGETPVQDSRDSCPTGTCTDRQVGYPTGWWWDTEWWDRRLAGPVRL